MRHLTPFYVPSSACRIGVWREVEATDRRSLATLRSTYTGRCPKPGRFLDMRRNRPHLRRTPAGATGESPEYPEDGQGGLSTQPT